MQEYYARSGRERGVCLITGANGFVGAALVERMRNERRPVIAAVRGARSSRGCVVGPALDALGDWRPLLVNVDSVIHAAARVHVVHETAADALSAFRRSNVEGTLNLARQAALAGVRRFLFISTIKVHGDESAPGCPFSAEAPISPQDAYAVTKAEAEYGLKRLSMETGMEVVIVRPPLIYGPGVKANFLSLMKWVRRGAPLPLGAIKDNRRSLVALDNLMDLVLTCIDHPAAAGRTFLVSDGEDLSTKDLVERLAAAMGVPARLLHLPVWMIESGARLLGKRAMIRRLCGNLQVDIASTCELLDWRPPIGVDEGLRRAVEGLEK